MIISQQGFWTLLMSRHYAKDAKVMTAYTAALRPRRDIVKEISTGNLGGSWSGNVPRLPLCRNAWDKESFGIFGTNKLPTTFSYLLANLSPAARMIFVESLKYTPIDPSDRMYPTPYLSLTSWPAKITQFASRVSSWFLCAQSKVRTSMQRYAEYIV